MAYTDNFPQRPVFMADFANGGRIDPRMTFTRASTANVWDGSKHKSSENLIAYSNDVSQSNWVKDGFSETGGQTAPDGGSDAYKLTENTANDEHRIYQASSERITSSGSLTVSVHLKYIGRQWAVIRITDSTGTDRRVWFDIQNGTKGTEETNMTGSITASGNGYYKCVATISSVAPSPGTYVMIAGADADNSYVYTGSGADAFAVWGIQASTTGESVLNETSGSIHREYAPSLVSKSNNVGRFDHSTDGQSVAKGILIEGAATNLLNYSEQFDNGYWTKSNTTVAANAAVAPSGELTADLITADQTGGSTSHNCSRSFAFTSGNTYTLSVYAKAAGYSKLWLYRGNPATWEGVATFELTGSGAVSNVTGSAQIQPCGNGWYRCSVTGTAGATASTSLLFGLDNGDGTLVYDGDDYSGVLLWGAQMEQASFASSYIKVEGSTATRAAESLSMTDSSLFDNGEGAVVVDASASGYNFGRFFALSDGGSNDNSIQMFAQSTTQVASDWRVGGTTVRQMSKSGLPTLSGGNKAAVSWETNQLRQAFNGVETNTYTTYPVAPITKLDIGCWGSGNQADGHIKRIAVYGEPMSQTEIQALTS